MQRNDEYVAIKSLSELRRKITSVEREIALREKNLRDDCDELRQVFTLNYQMDRAMGRLGGIRKKMEAFSNGMSYMADFVSNFRERMRRAHEEEEECVTTSAESTSTEHVPEPMAEGVGYREIEVTDGEEQLPGTSDSAVATEKPLETGYTAPAAEAQPTPEPTTKSSEQAKGGC